LNKIENAFLPIGQHTKIILAALARQRKFK